MQQNKTMFRCHRSSVFSFPSPSLLPLHCQPLLWPPFPLRPLSRLHNLFPLTCPLLFLCTHTHGALTYFFWIIQLEIREALGQTLPCLDSICGSFQRSGLHPFLLGVLHMQYQACKPLHVCLYFKACQFNALQCEEWTLENKDKGRCKKEQTEKDRKLYIFDSSTLMGAVTFFGWCSKKTQMGELWAPLGYLLCLI